MHYLQHRDTSSAQYLKRTGLSLRQRTAVFRSSLTSGLSMSLSLLHSDWTHLDWGTHHKMPNLSKTNGATILNQFYMALNACQIKYFRHLQQNQHFIFQKIRSTSNCARNLFYFSNSESHYSKSQMTDHIKVQFNPIILYIYHRTRQECQDLAQCGNGLTR